MILKEKKITGNLSYDGVLLKLHCDEVILPGGEKSVREWIDHPGAAAVIPLLPDNRVVLVRQFRYPVNRETLEIPAGKIDPGESPRQCAERELAEETGFSGGSFQKIGSFITTPAFTNEKIHLFLTKKPAPGTTGPDEDEYVNTSILEISEVLNMIDQGLIMDAKTIIAFLLAQRKGFL